MTSDPYRELRRLAEHEHPRYDRRYGTCAACGLAATSLVRVDSILWAACSSCNTRWAVGENVVTDPPDDPTDEDALAPADRAALEEQVLHDVMLWLSERQLLVPTTTDDCEEIPTMRRPQTETPAAVPEFSYRRFLPLLDRPDPLAGARLDDATAHRVAGVLLAAFGRHPWIRIGPHAAPPLATWTEVRDIALDDRTTIGAVLALRGSPQQVIGDFARLVIALNARRAQLQAALDTLAELPDFAATAEPPPPPRIAGVFGFDATVLR